jgi:hypothetical protein
MICEQIILERESSNAKTEIGKAENRNPTSISFQLSERG